MESQIIEGITVITNALKAGHSFQTAMGNIAVDMEGPMAEEFGRVTRETQRGMTLEASFNSLCRESEVMTWNALPDHTYPKKSWW